MRPAIGTLYGYLGIVNSLLLRIYNGDDVTFGDIYVHRLLFVPHLIEEVARV